MTGQKRARMQGDIFKPARSQSSSVLLNFAHDAIGLVVEHQREGIILRAAALPARFVSENADLAQATPPLNVRTPRGSNPSAFGKSFAKGHPPAS